MKIENIVSELTYLKNWLVRNGFPGSKRAVIALREAIRILESKEKEDQG